MSDNDKDKLESAETPEVSPTDNETQVKEVEETKPTSEAESKWESMKGSTQERIVKLVRDKNETKAELERERLTKAQSVDQPVPQPASAPTELEVQDAVKKLRDYGVVTKDDLDRLKGNMYLEKEHDRLKAKFDGSEGLPKYISEEVEDYARSHNLGGHLQIAYEQMYRDELLDAEVKKRGTKKTTYTEKPTASVKIGEKPLTIESLRARLRQPDSAEWWAKNREIIEPQLPKLTQR